MTLGEAVSFCGRDGDKLTFPLLSYRKCFQQTASDFQLIQHLPQLQRAASPDLIVF